MTIGPHKERVDGHNYAACQDSLCGRCDAYQIGYAHGKDDNKVTASGCGDGSPYVRDLLRLQRGRGW